jgi:hypothetical protein
VPPVLQNAEEGLCMDGRVSKILGRAQAVTDIPTIAEPFPTRRSPLLVLSGLLDSCQLNSHQGGRWYTVASILHQQSLPRSRRKISSNGETGTSSRHRIQLSTQLSSGRTVVHSCQYTTPAKPSKEQKKDIQQWRNWH